MIFKRKLYDTLLQWKKEESGKSALLIEGIRRVGKSTLVEEFAKNEYKSYILIDFDKEDKDVRAIFQKGFRKLDDFFRSLSEYYDNTPLYERNTLFIFDEVQRFPRAREAIKYLVKDGRFDFIETGSLITMKLIKKDMTLPSEETSITLFPMDFEEFLWSQKDYDTIPSLKSHFETLTPFGNEVNNVNMSKFLTYMVVGGMPQVVETFLNDKTSYSKADTQKRKILDLYEGDLGKYDREAHTHTFQAFHNLSSNLNRHNKELIFASVKTSYGYRQLQDTIKGIIDSKIALPCYNSTSPEVGLSLYAREKSLKLYMADTGLLITQALKDKVVTTDDVYKKLVLGKLNTNKGMFFENAVAQSLTSAGHHLFFHKFHSSKDKKDKEKEIDFMIQRNGKISPIEVKSSSYSNHKSLDAFLQKYKVKKLGQPYVIYGKDIKQENGVTFLPIYLTMFL